MSVNELYENFSTGLERANRFKQSVTNGWHFSMTLKYILQLKAPKKTEIFVGMIQNVVF